MRIRQSGQMSRSLPLGRAGQRGSAGFGAIPWPSSVTALQHGFRIRAPAHSPARIEGCP